MNIDFDMYSASMDARVIWDIIGSFATLAERPVWAKATSGFNYDRQFDQTWLNMLPRLAVLAAGEDDIVRLGEVKEILFVESLHDIAKAAASNGHIRPLKWLMENRPSAVGDSSHVYANAWIYASSTTVREWALCQWEQDPENSYGILGDGDVEDFIRRATLYAAERGSLPTVQHALEYRIHANEYEYKYHNSDEIAGSFANIPPICIFNSAIDKGHTNIIEWGITTNYILPNEDLMLKAVRAEQMSVIELLIHHNCQITTDIVKEAAGCIDDKILRYIISRAPNNWSHNPGIFTRAAASGNVATVEWLRSEYKCAMDLRSALESAIDLSLYPIVEHLLTTYGPVNVNNANFYFIPAKNGDTHMAKLLHEHKVPLSNEIVTAACYNRVCMLDLFHRMGAPLTANLLNEALKALSFQAVEWLQNAGCPYNNETVSLLKQRPASKWLRQKSAMSATSTKY